MYCMHWVPLHNSGEIHKLHPYLLHRTYAETVASLHCRTILLEMQQAYAEKKILFFISFCLYASSLAGITPHQPISTTYLFHKNDQVKAKKKKKKLLFSPPHPPSSSFHVSAENKRKVEKVCWQFIRRSEQSGEGGVGNGKMVRCQSIIIQLFSCSNHINYRQLFNKQTIFLRIFSDEKETPL